MYRDMGSLKYTILIADDEEKIRKVLKINLKNKYRVILAQNGNEAIEYLNNEVVHLVLADSADAGTQRSGFASICTAALQTYSRDHYYRFWFGRKRSTSNEDGGIRLYPQASKNSGDETTYRKSSSLCSGTH